MGAELLAAPYSMTLRKLILQCLCLRFTERPSGREIVDVCEEALKALGIPESEMLEDEELDSGMDWEPAPEPAPRRPLRRMRLWK